MSSLGPEWHLSQEGFKLISDGGNIKDRSSLLKNAADSDLKEIGQAILNEELAKGKVVLQIQKIRNVAAPKANEGSQAAPRMLKLVLTDGVSYAQAVETSPISSISRDKTPPGTKILLNNVKVVSGFLLINPRNCTFLGGKVPHLHEKWEIAKSVQTHNRQSSTDGAPAWVNFGSKIQTSQKQDFKSLDNKMKDVTKENSEFEQLRKDAIAEAATGAVRKVFGGASVAKQSMSNNQNNKRFPENRERNNKQFKGKNVAKIENDIEKPQKPSENVSLFSFLENKLPVHEANSDNTYSKSSSLSSSINQMNSHTSNKYNSNYDRSKYSEGSTVQNDYNKREYNQKFDYTNRNESNRRQSRQPTYADNTSNYYDDKDKNRQNFKHGNKNSYSQDSLRGPQQEFYMDRMNHNQDRPKEFHQTNSTPSTHTSDQLDSSNIDKDIKSNIDKIVNDMNKITLNNSQFASRSLKQHLNLSNAKKPNPLAVKNSSNNPSNQWRWNCSDECLAKYWEDGKYYEAVVIAVTDKTCVVRFNGYENIEEVLQSDCLPITNVQQESQIRQHSAPNKPTYSGPTEYRRSTKTYSRRQ